MKKSRKYFDGHENIKRAAAAIIAAAAMLPPLSAQSVIELPELTTAVSGESLTVPEEALPDFTPVLPPQKSDLPVLPEIAAEQHSSVPIGAENSGQKHGSTHIEGFAGCGYPLFFLGDFSIYRHNGADPFSLHFSHETVNSFNTADASEGFFGHKTSLDAAKRIAVSSIVSADINAQYMTATTGLQQQSPILHDISTQQLGANFALNCMFTNALTMKTDLQFAYGNLFGGHIRDENRSVPVPDAAAIDRIPSVDRILFSPCFELKYAEKKIGAAFAAQYTLRTVSADERAVTHRGFFSLSGSYDFTYFKGAASGGIVIRDQIVFPFSLDISTALVSELSDKPFTVSVSGGLRSSQFDPAEFQRKNPYCYFTDKSEEQTDWFICGKTEVPIGAAFSFGADINVSKTAFGNGTITAVYCDASGSYIPNETSGLFSSARKDIFRFDTEFRCAYSAKVFSAAAGLVSRWQDKNDLDAANALFGEFSAAAADGNTGFSCRIQYDIKKDAVPECSASMWQRFSDAFRLAVDIHDIVKLVTYSDRIICGNYITRGGYVSVTAKFNY
ncbi:MAG: hypothetical protein NC041_09810 [Bacteroides sp.]|nr:hypothetical protein [Prevotella sp.]MCM1408539.1 hypothetical protein [Treponema brennaborense]MCM1470747.1 hypothetical protein [Bacteroides sp.]